ncbi:hypothetical protein Tco_1374270, partial [Tanacetum coccineum]
LGDADMQLLARVSVFISKDPFTALTSSLQRDLVMVILKPCAKNQGMVITLEREVVNHTYSFYATSSQVHKSLIKAILTDSLYVERAKVDVDFDFVGVRQLPKRHGGVDDGSFADLLLNFF